VRTHYNRITRDELGLLLAYCWSLRGTCVRRRTGCVLVDIDGREIGHGYNVPASDEVHCIDHPCPGAGLPSGTGLSKCEAIHAEANALLFCPDVRQIHTAYCTASPCIDCAKLLMNTGCQHVVFIEAYPHDSESKALWTKSGHRTWIQGELGIPIDWSRMARAMQRQPFLAHGTEEDIEIGLKEAGLR